jgi:bifunctional DNA-binding transcriptional regulator/antitoxin component of YhaV-PrlF toxin-antitoxin module
MTEVLGLATVYKANGNDALALMIPKAVRERFKITKGATYLVTVEKDGKIIYEPNR